MIDLHEALHKLMDGHGLPVFDESGTIAVQGNPARIEAQIVREIAHPQTLIVQLDVNTTLKDGLVIVESCAGMGSTRDEAAWNALQNFSIYSLHVLLAAVWDKIEPSQSRNLGGWRCELAGRHWPVCNEASAPGQPDAPARRFSANPNRNRQLTIGRRLELVQVVLC